MCLREDESSELGEKEKQFLLIFFIEILTELNGLLKTERQTPDYEQFWHTYEFFF